MAAITRQLASVLFLAALCCGPLVSRAQDPFAPPKPGGAAPGEAAAPPMPQDPFGAAPAPQPGTDKATGPQLAEEALPLVLQQLRDSNPQTPKAILQAANAVLQFGRPDEAKKYLARFLAAKFPEDQLAPVPHQVGSDLLIHLVRNEGVQPEGKEVARIVQEAAYKKATDVAEIEKTIALLSSPSLSIRQSALEKLGESGTHVVTPMLRVLADSSREGEHRFVRVALAHLAVATELPLIGALEIPDEHVQAQVVAVLGRIRSKPAVMHFVRPAVDPAASRVLREVAAASLAKIVGSAPDRYAAEKYLDEQIELLLGGNLPYAADPDGLIEMWFWDEPQRAVASRKLSKGDAALLLATRLTSDLAALNPQSEKARRMKLLTSLELAKVLGGMDQPLRMGEGTAADAATKAGPEVINAVLAEALKLGRIPAVLAAVELLGQSGDPEVLTSAGPQESPLAKALKHTDRRVRLTAALAIARLKPRVAFPGASRVFDPLAAAIRTTGTSRVLIGHPRGEEAQTLVGFMNDLGLAGEAAYTGRRLAEAATSGVDFEFILISDAIDSPPVKELVQWLRKDYRTAGIPIGVMARTEALYPLRYAFENDPLTSVFPRLYTTDAATGEVAKVIASAGRNHISREERMAQAQAAMGAIADLAASPEAFTHWNIIRYEPAVIEALDNPVLTDQAAAVLGKLGTPTSQKALVDFASQHTRPISSREAAAAAFAAAVKARGLNLTQQQIMTQFDRYNASERQDAQTQAVLGSLLDAIEGMRSQ
ncbi:MAG: hypothetical protein L0211_09925 [Planctomycetaceae bacterium]|nr:hypothetical protein [Planctomycetaceae bacterium]